MINTSKTTLLSLTDHCTLPIRINGQSIEIIDEFVYPEKVVFADDGIECTVVRCINNAKFIFAVLICKCSYLTTNIKLQLPCTSVFSVLLYEISTCKVIATVTETPQASISSCLRHVSEIFSSKIITNEWSYIKGG